jgi:hypothetical protein
MLDYDGFLQSKGIVIAEEASGASFGAGKGRMAKGAEDATPA